MISIREIAQLPPFENAEITAAENGFARHVNGFALLENPGRNGSLRYICSPPQDGRSVLILMPYGGFSAITEEQRSAVRKLLSDSGTAGMILFKAGPVSENERRLTDECRRYGIPLIVVRGAAKGEAFASVIRETAALLYRDRYSSEKLTVEMIDVLMSSYPFKEADILNRIGERTDCLLAFGKGSRIADCSDLPPETGISWDDLWLSECRDIPEQNLFLSRTALDIESAGGYQMLIVRRGRNISRRETEEISRTLSHILDFYGSLWARHLPKSLSDNIFSDEVIVSDEFIRLHSMNADVMKYLWVFVSTDGSDLCDRLEQIISEASQNVKISYLSSRAGSILIFMDDPLDDAELGEWTHHMARFLRENNIPCAIVRGFGMYTANEIRSVCRGAEKHLEDTLVIFRNKDYLEYTDVLVARLCRYLLETDISRFRWIDRRLSADGNDFLSDTVSTFLLDTKASITETAQIMYLHRNTVKYRLKRAGECLGYSLSDPVVTSGLVVYCGMKRLLEHDGKNI